MRPQLAKPGDMGQLHDFMSAAKRAVGPNGRVLFRTCPRGSYRNRPAAVRTAGAEDSRGCDNTAYCDEPWRALLFAGWELFDLFRLTEELWAYISGCRGGCRRPYVDAHHFQCDVLREFNLRLAGHLCGGLGPARAPAWEASMQGS